MTCEKAAELHVAEKYVLGQLEDDSRRAYEKHYFECSECQNTVRTMMAVQDELRQGHRSHAVSGSWKQWMAIDATLLVVSGAAVYIRFTQDRGDPIAVASFSEQEVPHMYRDFVRRALASGTVETPASIGVLRGQLSAQRGGALPASPAAL